MKTIVIRSIIGLLMGITISLLGLSYWLANPFDHQAWRIKLQLPLPLQLLGTVQLRAYPVVQLVTSLPGRMILDGSQWQGSHGRVLLNNEFGSVRINCETCTFYIPELNKYPVRLDRLILTVKHTNQSVSGLLEVHSGRYTNRIQYVGHINSQGVALDWSLPKTPLKALLHPLQSHSLALQNANVFGTLAAKGTLHWPSRRWSAVPELQGLEVTGLGTEKLKAAKLTYHCPSVPGSIDSSTYAWISEKGMGRWLPKAVLIAEDANFYRHLGYNMDILRFLLAQENREKPLGGSTITQQLAKYFFTGGERTLLRKLEELLYAVEMEDTLGKRLILSLYLNTVDWGPGICGAGQAAKAYFGRTPAQLDAVQAAWLAGIIRKPHQAWQQEYLPQLPDVKRLSRIMAYMPKKVRHSPLALKFAEPPSSTPTYASLM